MSKKKPKFNFYEEKTNLELRDGVYYLNGKEASNDEVTNIFIELGFKRIVE